MSGTTADLIGSAGGVLPNGLLNGASALQVSYLDSAAAGPLSGGSVPPGVKTALSGAVTASTLKTMLNLSGRGSLDFLAFAGQDTTARTQRLVLTIDGVVVFDASTSQAQNGALCHFFPVIGSVVAAGANGTPMAIWRPFLFNVSCKVEYSSSLGETDKGRIGYSYTPRA